MFQPFDDENEHNHLCSILKMCAYHIVLPLFTCHPSNYELKFKEFPTLSIIFFSLSSHSIHLFPLFFPYTHSFLFFIPARNRYHIRTGSLPSLARAFSPDNFQQDFHGVHTKWWYANHVESKEGHKLKLDYKLEYSQFLSFCALAQLHIRSCVCMFVCCFCFFSVAAVHWAEMNVITNILHTHFASIGCIKVAARAI